MTASSLLAMGLCSSLMFPLMTQPLSLGLSIMISTLFMCMLCAMLISSWYAYILFLIYVGGLLVMFAYVAALSPNVLFSSMNAIIFFLLVFIPTTLIFFNYHFVDVSLLETFNFWAESKKLKSYGIELVSPYYISILVALGTILLLNLIVVVKICFYQRSSLRPFKQYA
uniref:NADH-ubiquinone oxidoreductase chain 6 n=2 Tax=Potamopyrgus antipodarum TaxID=145637 RepID=D3JB29_POTAT|nr:NADH dehydrogenase subunit 6 [Potamopyrgus antipodarum]ADB93594.1 NADH dehydrogenase subunit 6 [Potamopyrgus antipodarum]ADB93607.1 NADH dehydrogenase subunit 6 [Potamopyrgus antipodarum]AVY52135.1 NADH dehydrogenase subunit 6 [Potamopyrgus antipodarum]